MEMDSLARQQLTEMGILLAEEKPFKLTCDSFGEWLRKIKEQHGYTYEYMAQKTGISKFALQSYVTRSAPPSLSSVERIVKAFGKHIEIR